MKEKDRTGDRYLRVPQICKVIDSILELRTTATPEVVTWVSSTCGSVKNVEVSYFGAGFREQHLLYSMEATINVVEAYWLTF